MFLTSPILTQAYSQETSIFHGDHQYKYVFFIDSLPQPYFCDGVHGLWDEVIIISMSAVVA